MELPKKTGIMSFLNDSKACNANDIAKEHLNELKKMKLHGQYFEDQAKILDVNLSLSQQWLDQSHLRFENESLICAAQEQTLKTKYIQNKIWKMDCSPMCRLCKEEPETISHIVLGCKMLAASKYTFRHNQIAKYIHWNILKDNGFKVVNNWIQHKPKESTIINNMTITWDMSIITDKKVKHN